MKAQHWLNLTFALLSLISAGWLASRFALHIDPATEISIAAYQAWDAAGTFVHNVRRSFD